MWLTYLAEIESASLSCMLGIAYSSCCGCCFAVGCCCLVVLGRAARPLLSAVSVTVDIVQHRCLMDSITLSVDSMFCVCLCIFLTTCFFSLCRIVTVIDGGELGEGLLSFWLRGQANHLIKLDNVHFFFALTPFGLATATLSRRSHVVDASWQFVFEPWSSAGELVGTLFGHCLWKACRKKDVWLRLETFLYIL